MTLEAFTTLALAEVGTDFGTALAQLQRTLTAERGDRESNLVRPRWSHYSNFYRPNADNL
jgi:hypothetical protein